MKIAVLGAGAWGSALAQIYANSQQVWLWSHRPEHAAALEQSRENPKLPGITLHQKLNISSDLSACVYAAELIIIATPLASLRNTLQQACRINPDAALLSTCKGIELGSGLLSHQICHMSTPAHTRFGVLSGPTFAVEVARGLPAAAVIASNDSTLAEALVQQLHQPTFRLYANNDLIGVELGGALKNVAAIAAGICDGLAFGHNARAALLSRSLTEITRLGQAMGAQTETFMGLSGMGDLLLTCTGELSRNRKVGLELAKGQSLETVLAGLGHVAEGVYTVQSVHKLANQYKVEMPIAQTVHRLLYEQLPLRQAISEILAREPKNESASMALPLT